MAGNTLGDLLKAGQLDLLKQASGDGHVRELFQQMFSEKTLCQFPLFGQMTDTFQNAVNPIDFAFRVLVLDTFASLGIIFHDLSGPAYATKMRGFL